MLNQELLRSHRAEAVDAPNWRAIAKPRSLLEPLPGSSRVRVTFDGTGLTDELGRPIDPDGNDVAGGMGRFSFDTLALTPVFGTAVIGYLFAAQPEDGSGANVINHPLEGVVVSVDGSDQDLRAVTDANGFFKLEPVPAGRFFVKIDGRTAKESTYPDGAYYPYVGKAWDAWLA
jgi:hypothetical protein